MFFLLREVGKKGERGDQQLPWHQRHRSFAQEEFVRVICKQQSQPAFTATTAGKCKAPLVQLERGFGVPLSHSPNPEVTGKRGNKKCPTKTKKTKPTAAVSKREFSIFNIFIDFSNMVQVMQNCNNQNHIAK